MIARLALALQSVSLPWSTMLKWLILNSPISPKSKNAHVRAVAEGVANRTVGGDFSEEREISCATLGVVAFAALHLQAHLILRVCGPLVRRH